MSAAQRLQYIAVNRFDSQLYDARLAEVENIICCMDKEERFEFARRTSQRLKSLAKVKADLTVPTPVGGYNQARSSIIDREYFFEHVHWILKNAPPSADKNKSA